MDGVLRVAGACAALRACAVGRKAQAAIAALRARGWKGAPVFSPPKPERRRADNHSKKPNGDVHICFSNPIRVGVSVSTEPPSKWQE